MGFRVGDVFMVHLLETRSLYVKLPNNCFMQLTGKKTSRLGITVQPWKNDWCSQTYLLLFPFGDLCS